MIDSDTIKTYAAFSPDDVILLVAYASCAENQDAIDASVVGALGKRAMLAPASSSSTSSLSTPSTNELKSPTVMRPWAGLNMSPRVYDRYHL